MPCYRWFVLLAGVLCLPFAVTVAQDAPRIDIPDQRPAAVYPALQTIAADDGVIVDVAVVIHDLTHPYPDDLDLLLVSPGGLPIVLMSDACGGTPLEAVTLTFDPDAERAIPDHDGCSTGTYRPAGYGGNDLAVDAFPPPAPSAASAAGLDALFGTPAGGDWMLYLMDDQAGDAGAFAGWSLEVETAPAGAPPSPDVNLLTDARFDPLQPTWGVEGLTVRRGADGLTVRARDSQAGGSLYQFALQDVPPITPYRFEVRAANPSRQPGVLILLAHDPERRELRRCDFGLPAEMPTQTYRLDFRTRFPWPSMVVQVITAGDAALLLDDAALTYHPELDALTTAPDCHVVAPAGVNLLRNGDFSAGLNDFVRVSSALRVRPIDGNPMLELAGWRGSVTSGIVQYTRYDLPPDAVLTFSLRIANLRPDGAGLNLIVRDLGWEDDRNCIVRLPPHQPMAEYTMRVRTRIAWRDAAISLVDQQYDYIGTRASNFRLDDLRLVYEPEAVLDGDLECPSEPTG